MVFLETLVPSRRQHSPLQKDHMHLAVQPESDNLFCIPDTAFVVPLLGEKARESVT